MGAHVSNRMTIGMGLQVTTRSVKLFAAALDYG